MQAAQTDDIQALERVHDRLAATNDDKLQGVLAKLLPKLVEMMAQDQLRNKVSQIFSHLLKRVRPNESIKLPVMYVPSQHIRMKCARGLVLQLIGNVVPHQ